MLARSVLSLERELRDKDRTIHKLHREIRELQRERDDRHETWQFLPAAFSEAYVDLIHLAHKGVSSESQGSNPNGPSSRAPMHDPIAYARLESENRKLVQRAAGMQSFLADRIHTA